jgi:hypothetical protein
VGQKRCRVSVHDLEGTAHTVEVTADSLYEAVARGMKALQSKDWSAPGAFEASYIRVTVAEPEVTHQVSVKKFNEWLERSHGSPRDTIQRQKVRSILNG